MDVCYNKVYKHAIIIIIRHRSASHVYNLPAGQLLAPKPGLTGRTDLALSS